MQSRSLDRLSSAVAEDDSCVSVTRDTLFGLDILLFWQNIFIFEVIRMILYWYVFS